MRKPQVSIVIVNFNGKDLLNGLLSSIKSQDYKNYEVIIVDNNSTDGSQASIRKNHRNVKLVQNKQNLGYSGINSAIGHCRGEYILFLNNDMELDEKCISSLAKTLESDKEIAMAAPKLVNFYERKLQSGGTWISRAFYNGHIKGSGNEPIEIPYLGVGLIKKEFVQQFGYLFDKDYFIYAEDVELGLRIRLCGKKIVFCPDAIIFHMHAVTSQKIGKGSTIHLMERNLLTTFFKILSLKSMVLFLPYVLILRIVAIILDLFNLRLSAAFSRLRAVLWVAFNMGLIAEKRRQTQKFRRANDSYILKVFSEKYIFRKKFIV